MLWLPKEYYIKNFSPEWAFPIGSVAKWFGFTKPLFVYINAKLSDKIKRPVHLHKQFLILGI